MDTGGRRRRRRFAVPPLASGIESRSNRNHAPGRQKLAGCVFCFVFPRNLDLDGLESSFCDSQSRSRARNAVVLRAGRRLAIDRERGLAESEFRSIARSLAGTSRSTPTVTVRHGQQALRRARRIAPIDPPPVDRRRTPDGPTRSS